MDLKPTLKIVCKASPAHMLIMPRRWSDGVTDGLFGKEALPVRAPFPGIAHQILDTLRRHKVALCTCDQCRTASIPAFQPGTPQRFHIKGVSPRIQLARTRTASRKLPLRFCWQT